MCAYLVSSWAWDFVQRFFSLAPAKGTTEVAHAAAFVLGLEISAIFADREGGRILPWSRNCQFLMVCEDDFG